MEGLYFYCCLSVCVSVCLSVCVSGSACEQNSSRTDTPIWTWFSLNGCLLHWLKPYWNWWPWVKGQSHSDFFLHNSLLTSLLYISALLCLIKLKSSAPFRYAICRSVKIKWVMTSWWRHLSFLHTNVHISILLNSSRRSQVKVKCHRK